MVETLFRYLEIQVLHWRAKLSRVHCAYANLLQGAGMRMANKQQPQRVVCFDRRFDRKTIRAMLLTKTHHIEIASGGPES
jgi:hypothetical protein